MTSFASDNYSPAHPDVLAALAAASAGHEISYGEDPWTARLQDAVRSRFGPDAAAYPVLTGTGANVVALMAMLPRWGAVVATEHAHLNTDENGAPERVGGVKVLAVPAPDGKPRPTPWSGSRATSATRTARSRSSCPSRRPRSSARSTRPPRSARWPTPRTPGACACTSTGRASRTPPPRSTSRSGP